MPGEPGVTRSYLDHASTSPLRPEAREAMLAWADAADPGRVHAEGRMARAALEEGRERVAEFFGTRPRQVVFTSGATEAIVAATWGALRRDTRRAVVMSAVEHRVVREVTEREADRVIGVPVAADGTIDGEAFLEGASDPSVGLAHCQIANHEVGTLQPYEAIASGCRERGVLLHVDAASAAGHVPIHFDESGVDLMSVSSHKLGGPRGIGALLVRRGLRVEPLMAGGDQERARRAGMENVGAAFGFAAAVSAISIERDATRESALTDLARRAVLAVEGTSVYGPGDARMRAPHILCAAVEGVEAEPVLIGLDRDGVAVHSGSSCSSESLAASPVLQAMGVDAERTIRISVGWTSTGADIERFATAFAKVVPALRSLRGGS